MTKVSVAPFYLMGISVRTSNAEGEAIKAIPQLWNEFLGGAIAAKIPNKLGEEIYCMYTDYVSDHSEPYTVILGCKVANLNAIPEGMVGKSVEGGSYVKRLANGNLAEGALVEAWNKIWEEAFPRAYTADFEVYGPKAQNPLEAEVDIFVGV